MIGRAQHKHKQTRPLKMQLHQLATIEGMARYAGQHLALAKSFSNWKGADMENVVICIESMFAGGEGVGVVLIPI